MTYQEFLKNKKAVSIYTANKNPLQICPAELSADFDSILKKVSSFERSLKVLNMGSFDALDGFVPGNFLDQYYSMYDTLYNHVIKTYEKPENHQYLSKIYDFNQGVETRELNIDKVYYKTRRKFRSIKYDMFRTKTGRLATTAVSFPILNLKKDARKYVKPQNDCFVEFDYNAADIRVFLGLSGQTQPEEDIHEWNAKNIFNCEREDAKKYFFAWLYNGHAETRRGPQSDVSNIYEKDKVRDKYWDGQIVTNIFQRKIPSDFHHSLSYIIQSTASDLFFVQLNKVQNLLKGHKSHIAFSIHDCFVLDLAKEERNIIYEIKDIFSDTCLGKFKISIKIGKSFGNMEPLWIAS